jgi:redox-sensing transcriptional repressor
MIKQKNRVPQPVVSRMVQYFAHLDDLAGQGVEWVSSFDIGSSLGLTSATVRRDLVHLDFSGTTNRGYRVQGLLDSLSGFLGIDQTWRVAVVGAGNLGKALALHAEWSRRGFYIRAIFDVDRRKIGKRVGALEVLPMDKLPQTVRAEKISIGVLAVPAEEAQKVADLLIASGVQGIMNLALTHIVVPFRTHVLDGRLVGNMIELAHGIKSTRETR